MHCLKVILIASIMAFLVGSCGPSIYYLGEDFDRTRVIQVFYDEQEIQQPYTVIGRMAHDKEKEYDVERIKKNMIREAKKVGADGLIFSDLSVERLEHEQEDRVIIKAKAVKYE